MTARPEAASACGWVCPPDERAHDRSGDRTHEETTAAELVPDGRAVLTAQDDRSARGDPSARTAPAAFHTG
jgi:hypothetical protein